MAVQALIRFIQGPNSGLAGEGVVGTLTDGACTVSNGDDTGVISWKYEMLYVPPGSAVPLTVQGPGPTTTFAFTPDVAGTYRLRLTVAGTVVTDTETDIRCFAVPFPLGLIAPPYQRNPDPLPLTGAGGKPDEMNLGGQPFGWDGDNNASRKLLYQALEKLDALTPGSGGSPVVITPTTLASQEDDYTPTDFDVATHILQGTIGNQIITGFGVPITLTKVFFNTDTGGNITIAHQSLASTPVSRVICPNLADYVVAPLSAVILFYDQTAQRYRLETVPQGIIGTLGSTDNALVRTNGTLGNNAQGSAVTLSDLGFLNNLARLGIYSDTVTDGLISVGATHGLNGYTRGKFLKLVVDTFDILRGGVYGALVMELQTAAAAGAASVAAMALGNTGTTVKASAIAASGNVGVARVTHGSRTNATQVLVDPGAVDQTVALSSGGGGSVATWPTTADPVYVGHSTQFSSVHFDFGVVPPGQGLELSFHYSTGVGTWATFTALSYITDIDQTVVMWAPDELTSWVPGAGGYYWIRATRNNADVIVDGSTLDGVRVATGGTYYWDNQGRALLSSLQLALTATNSAVVPAQALWIPPTDVRVRQGANILAYVNDFQYFQSTGVYQGGVFSINADRAKFDLSDGFGWIVSATAPLPTVTRVEWSGLTAITLTYLATRSTTWIAIDSAGSVVQSDVAFTEAQKRSLIVLGRVAHPNGTSISDFVVFTYASYDFGGEFAQFAGIFGAINVSGNAFSWVGAGTTLEMSKSAGETWAYGVNYDIDRTQRSLGIDPLISPVTWGYLRRDPGEPSGFAITVPVTSIDPDNYDDGTGTLAAVPVNKWTVQRIYHESSSQTIRVHYGQNVYNSSAEAISGIADAIFATDPFLAGFALCTYLIVKQGTTQLNSVNAVFRSAGKFGSQFTVGGGGGGGSGTIGGSVGTVDNRVPRSDGTGGLTLQGSSLVVEDSGSTLISSTVGDTGLVASLEATGSNGALTQQYSGTRNPNGLITALPGALYYRDNGTSSRVYQLRSASSANSPWIEIGINTLAAAKRTTGALITGSNYIGFDLATVAANSDYLTFDGAGTWLFTRACTVRMLGNLSFFASTSGVGSILMELMRGVGGSFTTVIQGQRSSAEQATDNYTTMSAEGFYTFAVNDQLRMYVTNFGGSPNTIANMTTLSIHHVAG